MDAVILSRDIGGDGVHMNKHGYDKFYWKIAKYIESMKAMREEILSTGQEENMYEIEVQNTGGTDRSGITRNVWVRENMDRHERWYVPRNGRETKN